MSDLTPAVDDQNEKSHLAVAFFCYLAERVGFEPTVRSRVRLISSQVHSTTLPPLRSVESRIIAVVFTLTGKILKISLDCSIASRWVPVPAVLCPRRSPSFAQTHTSQRKL